MKVPTHKQKKLGGNCSDSGFFKRSFSQGFFFGQNWKFEGEYWKKRWNIFCFRMSELLLKTRRSCCGHTELLKPKHIYTPRRIFIKGACRTFNILKLLHAFSCPFELILPLWLGFSTFLSNPCGTYTHRLGTKLLIALLCGQFKKKIKRR